MMIPSIGRTLYPSIPATRTLAALLVLVACGPAEAQPEIPNAPASAEPTPTPASTPTPALAADLDELLGCWDMQVSLPFGATKSGKLCFASDETGALTARLFIKGEWRAAKAVRATAGHVELEIEAPVGATKISADYDADAMTGTVAASVGKRPFHAQRSPD